MAPIALGSKHQDLLKAYLEVSKSEKPDWNSIALKADFATPKYARDQFAIVKKKLLAAPNGEAIELSDSHSTLLQTVVGVLKADVRYCSCFLLTPWWLMINLHRPIGTRWRLWLSSKPQSTHVINGRLSRRSLVALPLLLPQLRPAARRLRLASARSLKVRVTMSRGAT
jgi:hypothetical protein